MENREQKIKQLLRKLAQEEKTNALFFEGEPHSKQLLNNISLKKTTKVISESYDAYTKDIQCLEQN